MVVVLQKEEEYNKDNLIKCNLILLNDGLHFLSVIAAATN